LRTLAAVLWLGLCSAIAYYIMSWLFESGAVSIGFFYSRLYVPRSVDPNIVRVVFTMFLVLLMQFFVLIGYAWASPVGRMRPGSPSLRRSRQDPEDQIFYR
jgi:hypothetical protein